MKNIIFDLSEVIISGLPGIEIIIEQETGILAEDFLKRKNETLDYFLDTMRGIHTEDEYWNNLTANTGWKISVQELKTFIRKNMNIPVVGVLDIIKCLKNNYNLILLSDHVKEWMDYILLNNQDIKLFDYTFFSYDLGNIKMDEECFKKVIKKTGIKPEETLFIDDNHDNVKSAKKSGIDGIVFKNALKLKEELRNRNIDV